MSATTLNASPSPSREANLVTSPEQLDQFCMKAFLKATKTPGNSPIINFSYLNKDGSPRKEVDMNMAPVEVQGIIMPFIRLTPDGKNHDVGAKIPQVKLALAAASLEGALIRADYQKINDAMFAYSYGLDTKPILRVERVPVKDMENTFSPVIHYADGTKLAVKKSDIVNEVKGNTFQYLEIPRRGEDVYFNDKTAPVLHKSIYEDTIYVEVELHCQGKYSMRRKNNIEPTPDQMNIDKWGVEIYETKLTEGGWVRRQENIANRLPQIRTPNGGGSFIANISFRPSCVSAGPKPKLHYEGTVCYVGPSEQGASAIPVGEFQSSLPVQQKKLQSKAMTGAVAAKTGKEVTDKEESEDEGEFG